MKKILIILCIVSFYCIAIANQPRGTTEQIYELDVQIGETIPEISRDEFYRLPDRQPDHSYKRIDRDKWKTVDSLSIRTLLPAGDQIGIRYCTSTGDFKPFISFGNLLPESIKALDKAPAWMYNELHNVLSQLSAERQAIWANLINETEDPYIDEIAFCIAYSAPEYLESQFSTPELFIENVKMIYYVEPKLPYVEIVHHGNSQTNPDYYSTTSYKIRDTEGNIEKLELPREIYYRYVVHSKVTGEIPAYIDPDIVECMQTRTNNIVDPGQGEFWRTFFWDVQDEGYPVLSDTLMQAKTYYNKDESPGCAIRTVQWWIRETMDFTSDHERPHQPVRIYRKHIGRCGEWADYTTAAARTALIPCINILTISTDHTWNEFWAGDWIHWEPVLGHLFGGDSIDYAFYYFDRGDPLGSVFQPRNDGYLKPVTERYIRDTPATINLSVVDNNNNPIDGARVLLATRDVYDPSRILFDTVGFTGNDGVVSFPVGINREYFARADTPIGNIPEQDNSVARLMENAQEGQVYHYRLPVNGSILTHNVTEISLPDKPHSGWKCLLSFSVPKYYITGRAPFDNLPGGYTFNELVNAPGEVNFLITDYDNWSFYRDANICDAYVYQRLIQEGKFAFDIPKGQDLYAYLDNSHRLRNTQHIDGIAVYKQRDVRVDDEIIYPETVRLYPNHPNPFNPNTVIPYYLPHSQHISLEIYNIKGQRVITLFDDVAKKGLNQAVWDGKNTTGQFVGSGIYFYRFSTDDFNKTRKMILIK